MRFRVVAILIGAAGLGTIAAAARAQSPSDTGSTTSAGPQSSSSTDASAPGTASTSAPPNAPQPQLDFTYRRPSEKTKVQHYLFDTFGPAPVGAAVVWGVVSQVYKTPPEWGVGAAPYGERVGSTFGIEAITTTTRYGLAEAFREDTLYYRCQCKGFFHRLGHAAISTVTARHGDDGAERLSFAALAAPYAGTMAAVYAWYPHRFGYKDGFRMGNYDLLTFTAVNIAREFIYGGPHTLFRHHNRSGSSGSNP